MANRVNNKRVCNELKTKLEKSNSVPKPKVQTKSLRTAKTFDSKTKHPTNVFIQRSENEFKKLETRIGDELRQHLSQLFESESFADVSIIRGKFQKRVHLCLLLTRIPQLFTKLLNLNLNKSAFNPQTNEYLVKIPPEIKESELKLLLQKIYSEYSVEDMEKEEQELVAKIQIFSKNVSSEQDLLNTDPNKEPIDSKNTMELSAKCVSHSDHLSDEERIDSEDLKFCDNIEDNNELKSTPNPDIMNPSPMVRSGTFELLSSIYSEDNYGLKDINSTEDKDLKETNVQKSEEKQKQMKASNSEAIDENCVETNESSNKNSNSMFSLFIDINQTLNETKETQRPQTNREDRRKGFDFIPLTNDSNQCKSANISHRRGRNSAEAVLIRSLDSCLPNTKTTLEDIPLLPMSPIVRRKPANYEKCNDSRNHKSQTLGPSGAQALNRSNSNFCSSSDSFSEAFNECLNISIESSSKNSYESDSIDMFEENNENSLNKSNSIDDSEESVNEEENDDFDLNESIRNMKSCSKLGDDLLKMFVQQINTDITIRVSDREINAHKCIITSRSRYFEAMLRGNWKESDANYVDLQGFSYNSVYFALCHIYSGCLTLPPKLDLSELALLSDVLAMDSLKEIVVHELMVNRCHFFHSPCNDNCIVSIIKCLKLCARSGLNDLYSKCLNWSAKHFTKVWINKAFASLKTPLREACFAAKTKQLLADNVLKTTLDCERMLTSMPRVKWAEPVFSLLAKLIEECMDFIAANYDQVIISKDFLALGRGNSWDISNLEQTLLASMTKLCPDVSCKALIELNKILLLQDEDQTNDGFSYGPFNDQFGRLVNKMQRFCERYMIQNANHVVHCQCWSLLSSESQQKIKDGAVIVFEFDKPIARPPRLSSSFHRREVKPKKLIETSRVDKSNDSNSTKGAVPKGLVKKSTFRVNTNTKTNNTLNQKAVGADQHIYDTVPFEGISSNKPKPSEHKRAEKVSNRALSLHLNRRKNEEKIAKVSPFSHKANNDLIIDETLDQNEDSLAVKDLVAEIDAETNLVTYCLQEAELLELELTRKFHKTHITSTGAENKSTSVTSAPVVSAQSPQRQTSVRSVGRHTTRDANLRKTTAKSQTVSNSILKSRALPKIPNHRK